MNNKYTITLTCSCGTVERKHVTYSQLQVEAAEILKEHDKTCAKKAGIGYEKENK